MKFHFVAIASLSLVAAACSTAPKAPVNVRVVTPFASGHILSDAALRFKQNLEAAAPHMKVTVQASVLNEQTINPAMQACEAGARTGDVMLTGGQPIQDYAPKYFFFNGPYVIRDFDHFMRVWNSNLGSDLKKQMEATGKLVSLEPVYRGYRQFTASKAISKPADFAGLKLRLPPTPDWIAVWSSLGTQPVQVPLPGIYEALKNKTAEASEGDLTQIQSLKLNEVQSHLALTNHLVGFGLTMANTCFYQGLSASDRQALTKAMKDAANWATQTIKDREASLLAQLRSAGMTVVTPDAAAIRQAAQPAINKLFQSNWTVTTWQDVLSK